MQLSDLIVSLREDRENGMRPLLIALLVVCAFVLLQSLLLVYRSVDRASVTPVPPAPDSLTVVPRLEPAAVTSEQSFELQTRPVFWQSRSPIDPLTPALTDEELAATEAAEQLRGLEVTGIIANADRSQAIVTYKGEQRRVESGQDLDGWTLVEVRPDAVVFASAGARDERRLSPMPLFDDSETENKTGDSNVTQEPVTEQPEQDESLTLGGR